MKTRQVFVANWFNLATLIIAILGISVALYANSISYEASKTAARANQIAEEANSIAKSAFEAQPKIISADYLRLIRSNVLCRHSSGAINWYIDAALSITLANLGSKTTSPISFGTFTEASSQDKQIRMWTQPYDFESQETFEQWLTEARGERSGKRWFSPEFYMLESDSPAEYIRFSLPFDLNGGTTRTLMKNVLIIVSTDSGSVTIDELIDYITNNRIEEGYYVEFADSTILRQKVPLSSFIHVEAFRNDLQFIDPPYQLPECSTDFSTILGK